MSRITNIGAVVGALAGLIAVTASATQIQDWWERRYGSEGAALASKPQASTAAAKPGTPSLAELRLPVDRLFEAWRKRDINLYMQQWDVGAVRSSKQNPTMSAEEFERQRNETFKKLAKVTEIHDVCYFGRAPDGSQVLFVKYVLTYHWKDGRVTSEEETVESYNLVFNDVQRRWLISRNVDSRHGAGCEFSAGT